MQNLTAKHGGKRKGAGRKPALEPLKTKKFRASDQEWQEFMSLLAGDARKDFELVFQAVLGARRLTSRAADNQALELLRRIQNDAYIADVDVEMYLGEIDAILANA